MNPTSSVSGPSYNPAHAHSPHRHSAGGHTIFPLATALNASSLDGVSMAGTEGAPVCDFPEVRQRRGLMVRPKRGDVLFFYSQLPGGALDGRTRHGSCPVLSGRKVVANVWYWNRHVIYK